MSRWLWLVKWLLVIPHVIVLAFLWLAVTGRGLVLVKWWLLAVPHYLVVAVFAGGPPIRSAQSCGGGAAWASSMLGPR